MPQFDVVRVEPSGDALLAGRGSPNATVSLMDRGRVVGEAKTDAAGNFVITPPALAPGDYALSLREGAGADAAESKQSVTVSIPKTKSQEVVVAMAEPGRPTTLLSLPPAASASPPPNPPSPAGAAPAAEPRLAIRSVEVENGAGFYATGIAPARGTVRLYLNDARIADVTAGPGGAWSITVRRGLAPGHYKVRADMIGAAEAVVARAEVPFDVPPPAVVAEAEPAKPASPGPANAASASVAAVGATSVNETPASPPASPMRSAKPGSPADVVLDRLATELVTRGDNLWRISRQRLGQGTRYTQIYAANAAQIRNPGLIYPGQVFVLPQE